MADYRNNINRLSQLSPALPPDNETADKTPAILRQLRAFLTTFLSVSHKDDGSLKDFGISDAQIGEGVIRGSDTNATSETNEILHGTISTPDLRDEAVSAAKLATGAVTNGKIFTDASTDANRPVVADSIRDGAVTTAKLPDGSITTPKYGAKSVDSVALANDAADDTKRAVGSLAIKNDAVITRTIGDKQVTMAKLESASNGKLLVGTGTDVQALPVGGVLTASVSAGTIVFALGGVTNGGSARYAQLTLEKSQNSNLVAGDFAAALIGTIQHVKWTATYDPGEMISLDVNGTFLIKKPGFYVVICELYFDSGTYDRALLSIVNSAQNGYTSHAVLSNGSSFTGFVNTTVADTRLAVVFKDGALSATTGTAKNKITTEVYARLSLLAL